MKRGALEQIYSEYKALCALLVPYLFLIHAVSEPFLIEAVQIRFSSGVGAVQVRFRYEWKKWEPARKKDCYSNREGVGGLTVT